MLLVEETGSSWERDFDRSLGYQYVFHCETLSLGFVVQRETPRGCLEDLSFIPSDYVE